MLPLGIGSLFFCSSQNVQQPTCYGSHQPQTFQRYKLKHNITRRTYTVFCKRQQKNVRQYVKSHELLGSGGGDSGGGGGASAGSKLLLISIVTCSTRRETATDVYMFDV